MLFVVLLLALITVLVLMRAFAADVYDAVVTHKLTTPWYAAVLTEMPLHAHVLDVGIGTATALANNIKLVRARGLHIVGIDYEPKYIEKAKRVVARHGLTDSVDVRCQSVYDALPQSMDQTGRYDAVYFSGSFTLLPDPVAALHQVATALKPSGKIYITQTFQKKAVPLLKVVKPLLKYATTIDFGQLTFETDVKAIVNKSGFGLDEYRAINTSVQNSYQTSRMLIISPRK
jgi:ubiquinone/menaquinone biosynthesis C-methylase UbiE